MTNHLATTDSIGLQDLLARLRDELIQDPPDSSKLFFVDGVELELHVDVKREAKGGIKISILQLGGLEGEAGVAREKGHKITLRLRPLITYEEARRRLQQRDPDLDTRLADELTMRPRR